MQCYGWESEQRTLKKWEGKLPQQLQSKSYWTYVLMHEGAYTCSKKIAVAFNNQAHMRSNPMHCCDSLKVVFSFNKTIRENALFALYPSTSDTLLYWSTFSFLLYWHCGSIYVDLQRHCFVWHCNIPCTAAFISFAAL